MSESAFARFKIISVAIFILGLLSVALAFTLQQTNAPKMQPAKGFTLRSRDVVTLSVPRQPGPNEIAYSEAVRYQKSDGTFREVRRYLNVNGKVLKKSILVGIPGQGVFSIDLPKGTLSFVSAMATKDKTSLVPITDGTSHPNFLKHELVKGYSTYVLRFPDQDGDYTDIYYSPDLNNQALRRVSVSSQAVAVEEVFQIELGDPDERAFAPLPKWLVNYDLFKQKIAHMEEAGNHTAAAAMRRELDEQIKKSGQD
jgi:hypothetical protein